MKALVLSDIFPPKTGGSGRWLWELYDRFPREEVVVVAGEDPRAEAFDRTHDLAIHRIPLCFRTWGIANRTGLTDYWKSLRAVMKIVKAETSAKIDQVHCARCLPEGWIAWLLKRRYGLPFACYVHGEDATCATSSRELSWMMRRVLKSASLVIANSSNTVSLLRQDWDVPESKIRMTHPGVDTRRFAPHPPDPEARQSLGWKDRSVVLTVGRLQQRKGHDRVIEALSTIRRQVPNILYSIVGDGDERSRLEELVRRHSVGDLVQFRGEPDDEELVRCYQQCDLFVLANRQVGLDIEGFGMVLVEAQACGKPVIAGASGGTAETMQPGVTGYIIPCDTPAALMDLIPRLLADEEQRRRMGEAGRRLVVEQFDWGPLAQQAHQIFRDGFHRTKAAD